MLEISRKFQMNQEKLHTSVDYSIRIGWLGTSGKY